MLSYGSQKTDDRVSGDTFCQMTHMVGQPLASGGFRQGALSLVLAAALVCLAGLQTSTVPTVAIGVAALAAVSLALLSFAADAERRRLAQNSLAWGNVYHATLRSLAAAIDARESPSSEHVSLVEIVASQIASDARLSPEDIAGIRTAALLLDIGTLGVPENILRSPDRLSPEEFAAIHSHPILGSQILERVAFPWGVHSAIRSHHERWDGSGYPDGIRAEQIPLASRILAVADVYAALRCKRAYRGEWSHDQAVRYIESESGRLFDPAVVRSFMRIQESIPATPGDIASTEVESASKRIASASQRFTALWEISQVANSTLDLHDWLYGLATRIATVLPCDACAIFLLDGQQRSVCRASWPAAASNLEKLQATIGSPGTGRCTYEPRPYIVQQSTDNLVGPDGEASVLPYVWTAIAPLRIKSEVLGSVNLYRKDSSFTMEELDLLDTLARHASVPIANASLYQATRESADRDPLTGLYNLRYFCAEMETEIARADRLRREFSLVAVDLDHFKRVNDTLGHGAGDDLLREVARVFTATVRDYDTVVRYGGDEFVIILPEANAEAADETIARLQHAIEEHAQGAPELRSLEFGASFGAATFPHDGRNAKSLLAEADRRMYQNKSITGRKQDAA